MFDRVIFQLFETCAPWLSLWVGAFVCWTGVRIARTVAGRPDRGASHFLVDEAPGLPLALLHSVAFVWAVLRVDLASALLFVWWGPGFLIVATIYIRAMRSGRKIDWRPVARATSIGCKLCYLTLMIVYFAYDMRGIMFTFSLWIMHDQVRLAWFRGTADRTRRTFEDLWIVRVLYPGLLLIPFFSPSMTLRAPFALLGSSVLALWIAGLVRVRSTGRFFEKPGDDSDNLRDIVYLDRSKSRPASESAV